MQCSSSSEKVHGAVHKRLRGVAACGPVRSRFVGGEDQVSSLAEASDREVLGHGGRRLDGVDRRQDGHDRAENRGESLSKTSWLVMSCRGFETEAQAREFGEELRRATHLAGLCNRLGVDAGDPGEDRTMSWLNPEIVDSTGHSGAEPCRDQRGPNRQAGAGSLDDRRGCPGRTPGPRLAARLGAHQPDRWPGADRRAPSRKRPARVTPPVAGGAPWWCLRRWEMLSG